MDAPQDAARNMARDHALTAAIGPGRGLVRIYRWSGPTVSLGRNQPARDLFDRAAAARLGIGFVRRPTGGRTVLHDRELTYAVALPVRALEGARRAYHAVNRGLLAALSALGIDGELAGDGGATLDGAPCFQRAAAGEVTVGGRKLVGSAQVRVSGALLQHGSILLEDGQGRLGELGPGLNGERAATSVREVLGRVPERPRMVSALVRGLSDVLGGRWEEAREGGDALLDPDVESRLVERYASDAWTWRR